MKNEELLVKIEARLDYLEFVLDERLPRKRDGLSASLKRRMSGSRVKTEEELIHDARVQRRNKLLSELEALEVPLEAEE